MASDNNPSNRLYRGEASDFRHAIKLVREMCDREKELNVRHHPDDQPARDCNDSLASYATAASAALAIYERHMALAKVLAVAEMRRVGTDDMNTIADALEADDYSQLAV